MKRERTLVIDEVGIASDRVHRWSEQESVSVEHSDRMVTVVLCPRDQPGSVLLLLHDDVDRVVAALRTFVPPDLLVAVRPPGRPSNQVHLNSRPLSGPLARIALAQAFGVAFAGFVLCGLAYLAEGYHLWSSGTMVALLLAVGFPVLCRWLYRTKPMTIVSAALAFCFLVEGTAMTRDAVHSAVLRVDGHPEQVTIGDSLRLGGSEVRLPYRRRGLGARHVAHRVIDRSGHGRIVSSGHCARQRRVLVS